MGGSGEVPGEPRGEDEEKELLCCSEIEAQRSAVVPWVAGLSLVPGLLQE